ncbi:MAG: DUF1553 domain-containing protein [Planctomycetaceae bacterium]|nr:DUF1553 domain-containing protein [Planctomycetaceae bacterium]
MNVPRQKNRRRTLSLKLTSLVVLSAAFATADEREDFFERRIRPVLVEHCYACHSEKAENIRGGLLLDSRAGSLAGGDSGAVIVPGQPDDSLLISALRHESFEMPPDRRLPDEVITDFERWIRDGATDPREGGKTIQRRQIDLQQGRQFRSFRPIQRPPVPDRGIDWARTDIDRFVAAEFDTAGVDPAADVPPAQLLRRLHFVLTGLPPTPEEIIAFEAAWRRDADQAVADVADRLLSSRHFGERFGRHWLDVTRFAESSGGGRSLMYPDAWRFRDYVVRSFNEDKPFNQLIREHVAGDLLPSADAAQRDDQVIGSGYLVFGPTNYEEQDKEQLQYDVVDEQIDTIGRTFLGMTLGCARCHDHKFDPIPMTDYYGLVGIFLSTETLTPGNVSGYVTTSLNADFDQAAYDAWKTQRDALKQQVTKLRSRLKLKDDRKSVAAADLEGIVVDDAQAVFSGEWISSTSVSPYVDSGYRHNQGNAAGHRVQFRAKTAEGTYRVRFSYSIGSNRSPRVPVVVTHAAGSSTVELNQQQLPDADGLFADLGEYRFSSSSPAIVSVNAEQADPGVVIVDAVQFIPVAAPKNPDAIANAEASDAAGNDDRKLLTAKQRRTLQADLQKLEANLKSHEAQQPPQPSAMSVRDVESPSDTRLLQRGVVRNFGPVVPRSALSVISTSDGPSETELLQIAEGQSGRAELANWIASPSNPLTARVFVNRIFGYTFGEGIVRTPDNFGFTGQPPTHPDLLDYLAATFIEEDHWSVKRLVRRMVTSRLFRLSSETDDTDPANELLTRGFRRPLDAEAFRDAVLSVSGRLDLSVTGGLTIARLTQYDNAYDHDRQPQAGRSVFVPALRNSPLPLFDIFDAANSNLVTGKRTVSTLPSQGLFLMNSPFILEQSKSAAERLLGRELTVDEMTQTAWLSTVGRRPNEREQAIVRRYLQSAADEVSAWAAVFQSLFSSVDFRYVE